jgi:iron(III) transport system ATP-binding protein
LARAIAPDVDVLLLDEPLSNLDRHVADMASELIRTIHLQRHLTSVLVTHDRHYAMGLASRVLVLSPKGSLIEDGSPDTVYADPRSLHSARVTGPLVEFPTKATGQQGNYVQFDLCGGSLAGTWRSCRSWDGRTSISAVARPESFEVVDSEVPNSFCCKVIGRGAADRRSNVICVLDDGTAFTISPQTQNCRWIVGSTIRLRVDPEAVFCFPQGDDS